MSLPLKYKGELCQGFSTDSGTKSTYMLSATGTGANPKGGSNYFETGYTGGNQSHTHTFTGTSTTINTVSPYITVYMYKRTA